MPAPAPWHHGSLLPALVEAADTLLATGGRAAVTLRAVAAAVPKGDARARPVTHTAAMAHVSGVSELLAHVSARWWERLATELDAAPDAPPDAPSRLQALVIAYRAFALAHPHHFRLMYDETIWRACETPHDAGFKQTALLERIVDARNAAFGAFARVVMDGVQAGTLRDDRSPYVMARALASLAHGLAMEALDERLPEHEVADIVALALDALLPTRRAATG
jgi:AcrR family transcriptional regulator